MLNKILFRLNKRLSPYFPRPAVAFAKEYFGDSEIIAAEIGVYAGHNAKSMLKELPITAIFLIDPYTNYSEEVGDVSKARALAQGRLTPFGPRINWIEKFSDEAADIVPYLDFLYIDGNHEYRFVEQDLRLYWPKIKEGGIMAGHDFDKDSPGVIRAVMEFCMEHKLTLQAYNNDWWVVKE